MLAQAKLHSCSGTYNGSISLLYAGWKESQKVFTDALAKSITADSSAYAGAEAKQRLQRPAGTRRMLATPQHHDPGYPAAQSASSTTQSNLNAHGSQSTAGPAHASESNSNTHDTTERTAEDAVFSSIAHALIAEADSAVDSEQTANQLDTCQADTVSTICADKDQPVLAPQAWEQEEEEAAPGLKLQQCQLLNASVCEPSVQMSREGQGFMVAVYNALAWERATEPIRVPLNVTAASAATWVVTGQCLCQCLC